MKRLDRELDARAIAECAWRYAKGHLELPAKQVLGRKTRGGCHLLDGWPINARWLAKQGHCVCKSGAHDIGLDARAKRVNPKGMQMAGGKIDRCRELGNPPGHRGIAFDAFAQHGDARIACWLDQSRRCGS